MIQLRPAQLVPINVQLYDGATDKVVKVTLEKMDGTDLTATIVLTNIGLGGYTNNVFPTPFGVEFFRSRVIVYESDGTTPATQYAQSTEDYQVIVPLLVVPLAVSIGCDDVAVGTPFEVMQTGDKSFLLKFKDEAGESLDISGATALAMKFKKAAGGSPIVKDLTAGITLINGKVGHALVQVLAADFALMAVGLNTVEVELTMAGQKTVDQLKECFDLVASAV